VSLPRTPAGGEAAAFGEREWLLTDGLGGFAAGTALDVPTRRYHGWLCARLPGSSQRTMQLAGADEQLLVGGRWQSLQSAHWRDQATASLPMGGRTFRHRPLPTWTFDVGGRQLERTLALRRDGERAAIVRWRNLSAQPLRLSVRPLLVCRPADALQSATAALAGDVESRGASWGFRPRPELPSLWLSVDGVAAFAADPCWYRGYLYAVDRARGYDHVEDRWSPGRLELDLPPHGAAVATFSVGEPCADPSTLFAAAAAAAVPAAATLRDRLLAGADDFLYRDDAGRLGIVAGLPWFLEWGRDTFLAAPGLLLARGRLADCAELLRGAARFLRRGLLPNVFGTGVADSHYDSADAALWFALCAQRALQAPDGSLDARGRADLERDLRPALRSIAEAYLAGTDLGLAVDADGLLDCGSADRNATWMDAMTSQGPVTPRHGQPVEIEALWFSLLSHLATIDGERWTAPRDRAGAAFVRRFWLADEQRLADRWQDGEPDRSIRPNMVLAAALPHSPLSSSQRAAIVACAERELLTPRGLRTLAPGDPAYRGRYEGDQDHRDRAYHQGTAWPWLLGSYVEAALAGNRGRGRSQVRARLRAVLDGFLPELDRVGLDHVSEVFDGDAPQRPGGTFAQAWNTGELLRALQLLQEAT
jgi:predicted glycogen debranching enzyme